MDARYRGCYNQRLMDGLGIFDRYMPTPEDDKWEYLLRSDELLLAVSSWLGWCDQKIQNIVWARVARREANAEFVREALREAYGQPDADEELE